jgi:hypothetical protein
MEEAKKDFKMLGNVARQNNRSKHIPLHKQQTAVDFLSELQN